MKLTWRPTVLLSLLAAAAPLAAQTTIHVPGDVGTIQGAIVLAQDGDTVLVAPGTYLEVIDFLGKAITVASESGAAATTIDAQGFNPVVAFLFDEGPGSVLRGFTVTGGIAGGNGGGIECSGAARPTVQGCVVRGNQSLAGSGAGVFGAPLLEDCLIEGNDAFSGGGAGVFGAPVMRRCVVRGNRAYEGAGLQLLGGRIEDTQILENSSAEGSGGGAVSIMGPGVVLLRCTIARNSQNTSGGYTTRGSGVNVGSGLSPVLAHCTIVSNIVVTPFDPGLCGTGPCPDTGGVFGPARLVNTIVRDNDDQELDPNGGITAHFCDIGGGYPGTGNFDLDPLFVDAPSGDYRLQPGSPCIDAGAPTVPLDPDGTRADVGALAFQHAVAFVRNGTGVDPLLLFSASPPAIGTTWIARIDASLVPGTTLSGVAGRTQALDPGILLPRGELLITGARLFGVMQASSGGTDDFPLPIPNDLALLGFEAHAQGYVIAAGRARLGNALRLLLGQ